MKVALIGPFPPYRGGIAQFTGILGKTFEDLGHDVLRITYSRLYPRLLFPGTTQFDPESDDLPSPTPVAMDSCRPWSWLKARKSLLESEPDLVVAKWWHPFFAPALLGTLSRRLRDRTVLVCHNVLPHEGFPFSSVLFRALLSRSSGLVVHSEEDRRRVLSIAPGHPVTRLYHPIYEQYLRPGVDRRAARRRIGYRDDDVVILFFGLVRPYKGVPDLVEAHAALEGSPQLLIVGECYGGRQETQRLIRGSTARDRVRWIDRFVPADEVSLYFEAADLVVLPYRRATQSGVAQIALAFRKPLVLTRTGGLSELVDEGSTGFLAEPADPGDLARAMRDALALARSTDGIAERIAEFSKRFDWPRYARRLIETGRGGAR